MYANSFNFLKYVKFRHEIKSIEMNVDYEETGQWNVCFKNMETLKETTEVFDGVMICTGHHGTVNQPTLSGQHQFKGIVMHSHSLKHSKGLLLK